MINNKKLIIAVFLLMILALSIALIFIMKERSSIYPYDVKQDYDYSFHQTDASITNLNFKNGNVVLPKKRSTVQTAFLKLNVKASFLGKYFLPHVEIIGKSSFTQYFEHGVAGVRYLNVSQLMSENETKLRLEGNHITIDEQSVQLIVFENQNINKSRILVVSPHPDDAEIAAFGVYSSNENSHILTVTAGEGGENKYDEVYENKVKQHLKKGELRTWNSITVPMLGGIRPEQSLNLGFFDGTLEEMFRSKSEQVSGILTNTSDINTFRKLNISSLSDSLSGKSDWNSLVENLEYLLKTIKPDIIVAPYPALDSHSDHKLSSIALFEALKKSGIKNGELYLYTNHYVLNEFYPYGKIGGIVSLPPNFEKAIYFNNIYSHPLSLDDQKNKIFGLEAHNDLRLDTEWLSSKGAIKHAYANIKRDINGKDNSYYKRAVRSNELFYVVKIANIYNQNNLDKIIGDF
ncbi:unnamed protein product [Scytosiphon promiscuus]